MQSPYMVSRLIDQQKNLYGRIKFERVAVEIQKLAEKLGRAPRVLDLGCSTRIAKAYLADHNVPFEYFGVDFEEAFAPDLVADVRHIDSYRSQLPWQPDVILLLDVLEHLDGAEAEIAQVLASCGRLIGPEGLVLVMVPQMYRLDRFKLSHLHYSEHKVRFTLAEWCSLVDSALEIQYCQGVGYLSVVPYLVMRLPNYEEKGRLGKVFHFLRGQVMEWRPFRPVESALTRTLGASERMQPWANSTLVVASGRACEQPPCESVPPVTSQPIYFRPQPMPRDLGQVQAAE